jgi:hypothetical protein
MPVEIFKPVVGYEGLYQVSSLGRVRAVAKTLADGRRRSTQFIGAQQPDGRNVVALHKNKQSKRFGIAYLVAEAFIGPAEGRRVIRRDGNVSNDVLSNLKYAEPGVKATANVLEPADVWRIRALLITGLSHKRIAEQFGVTNSTIGHIARGVTWANLSVSSLNAMLDANAAGAVAV